MGWLSDYAAAKAIDVDMAPSLGTTARDAERRVIADIQQKVEETCQEAIAKGLGWRVWRSDIESRLNNRTLNYALHYSIQLLEPGAPAPGSGTIYGPWPEDFATMSAEDRARLVMGLPTPDHETQEFDGAMDQFGKADDDG